jgi:Collagen triple helix repeat (20 copies)
MEMPFLFQTLVKHKCLKNRDYSCYNFKGNTGAAGSSGSTGATGSAGATGIQGPAGPTGGPGATGSSGLPGLLLSQNSSYHLCLLIQCFLPSCYQGGMAFISNPSAF